MNIKKRHTIYAFQDLDDKMLEIVLNDGQSYSGVSKMTFIDCLKDFFSGIKEKHSNTEFLAQYKVCSNCNINKTCYSFINSDRFCYISLIFEEKMNGDFSDIYVCDESGAMDLESPLSFFEDEKCDFVQTPENALIRSKSYYAYQEFMDEVEKNEVVSLDFYKKWYNKYSDFAYSSEFVSYYLDSAKFNILIDYCEHLDLFEAYDKKADVYVRKLFKGGEFNERKVEWLDKVKNKFFMQDEMIDEINLKENYLRLGNIKFEMTEKRGFCFLFLNYLKVKELENLEKGIKKLNKNLYNFVANPFDEKPKFNKDKKDIDVESPPEKLKTDEDDDFPF